MKSFKFIVHYRQAKIFGVCPTFLSEDVVMASSKAEAINLVEQGDRKILTVIGPIR